MSPKANRQPTTATDYWLSRVEPFDILPTGSPTAEVAKNPIASATQRRFTPASYVVIAITVVAALLRFFNLGRESLWFDEGISVFIAHLNWRALWQTVSASEVNMALYYVLLHLWIVFGQGEFIVRSLSALAGLIAVPVVYLLGKRMFNSRVALITSLLLATNTFHIKYSQEARAYSLVLLLATLSSLFFIRAVERRAWIDWLWYVVFAALAPYSHFYALLVLGAQWVSLLTLDPRNVPWRKFAISAGIIALLCLPLVVYVVKDHSGHLAWISRTTLFDLYGLFWVFAGSRFLILPFLAASIAAVFFLVSVWRKSECGYQNWRYAFLLIWLLFPVLVTFAISLWKPIFIDRFLIVCLPPFLMLAAIGLSRISSRWQLAGALAVLLVLEGQSLWKFETKLTKEDWRGASTYILSHESHFDGLIFYIPPGQFAFDYYVRLEGRANAMGKIVSTLEDDTGRMPESGVSLELHLAKQFPRIWLIETHLLDRTLVKKSLAIRAILANQYPDVLEQRFRGVDVILYSSHELAGGRR